MNDALPDTGSTGSNRSSNNDLEDRLEALRTQIHAVDEELIALVGRRRDLVVAIGEAKAALGLPILDPSQEARVVRRAAELARTLHVDEELTRDVVWRIIASARDEQEGRTRWGPPLSDSAVEGEAGAVEGEAEAAEGISAAEGSDVSD